MTGPNGYARRPLTAERVSPPATRLGGLREQLRLFGRKPCRPRFGIFVAPIRNPVYRTAESDADSD
jgi:hypothetical protein